MRMADDARLASYAMDMDKQMSGTMDSPRPVAMA